mgnify:CR=1 FL=1
MKLNFTKMQGAGNDYIYIDCRAAGLPPDAAAWAVQLSRRHFSVGADGVIYLCPPLRADGDAVMRMFNADGSEGVMCGNGVRCAAEFLYTHGVRRDCIRIDTPSAGQRVLHRVGDGLWQVEMGRFTAAPDAVGAVGLGGGPLLDVPLCAGGRAWRVHCVAVGNPHCVLFTHEPPPTGAELAAWAAAQGTKILILAHLSRENNTAARARQAVERKLRTYGLEPGQDVTVTVAGPDEPGPVFELEEKEAALW